MTKIINFLAYIIILIFIFIFMDIFVFNKILGFGNIKYKYNLNDVSTKVAYPYVGFVEKNIANAERYSMYYTGNKLYNNNEDKIRIAFFGGSTAAYRDLEKTDSLSIPKYVEKILKEKLNKDVIVLNYSCGGANHRQHLHMLLEFLPKFKPDIVIYYGGNNEILQYYLNDPRPGYPFNYFYTEFQTWKKFLLEYSAIVGVLDEKFNIWNLDKIQDRINFRSPEWEQNIINNYFETLKFSKIITESFKSDLFGDKTKFISIFQPIKMGKGDDPDIMNVISKIRNKLPNYDYAYDFYNKYNSFSDDVWYDNCHVRDEANQKMANEIADLLIYKYLKKYMKKT